MANLTTLYERFYVVITKKFEDILTTKILISDKHNLTSTRHEVNNMSMSDCSTPANTWNFFGIEFQRPM